MSELVRLQLQTRRSVAVAEGLAAGDPCTTGLHVLVNGPSRLVGSHVNMARFAGDELVACQPVAVCNTCITMQRATDAGLHLQRCAAGRSGRPGTGKSPRTVAPATAAAPLRLRRRPLRRRCRPRPASARGREGRASSSRAPRDQPGRERDVCLCGMAKRGEWPRVASCCMLQAFV